MSGHTADPELGQNDAGRTLVREAVRKLDEAWRAAGNAELARFVPPPAAAHRQPALVALVKVDQEYRWRTGERPLLEAYLQRWPELEEHAEALVKLLGAECLTRAVLDVLPSPEELEARFPHLWRGLDLTAIRAQADEERGSGARSAAKDTSGTSLTDSAAEAGAALPLAIPSQFGRYEIRGLLGRGGMATVYRAYDTQLHRQVALKIPRFDPTVDPVIGDRFLREAHAAAPLRHPNICPIYDFGQIDGSYYLSMAVIEGRTLAAAIKEGALAPREAAALVQKLARALETVHASGTIHRDIKASNVMIDRSGEPVLMDFGLARPTVPEKHLTTSRAFVGTPAYMSPEQVNNEPVDARSDIYSLGVLLYQMLTGELPFGGPLGELLASIARDTPRKPRTLCPDVDPALEWICLKMLSKRPADRFASATALAEALEQYLRGSFRPPRTPLRRRWLWGAAAAGAILVLGIIIKITIEIRTTDEEPAAARSEAPPPRDGRIRGVNPRGWMMPVYDIRATRFYPFPSEKRMDKCALERAWSCSGASPLTADVNEDGKLEMVVDDRGTIRCYDGGGQPVGPTIRNAGALNILADVDGDGLPEIITAPPVPDRAPGTKAELQFRVYGPAGQLLKTLATHGENLDLGAGFDPKPTMVVRAADRLLSQDPVQIVAARFQAGGRNTRGVVVFDYATGAERWYHATGPMVGDLAIDGFGGGLKKLIHASRGPCNDVLGTGLNGEHETSDKAAYVFCLNARDGRSEWTRQFAGPGVVEPGSGAGPQDGWGRTGTSVALADVGGDGMPEIIATSFRQWYQRDGVRLGEVPEHDLGRVYVLSPARGETLAGYDRNLGSKVEIGGVADFEGGGTPAVLVIVDDRKARTGSLQMLRLAEGLPIVRQYDARGSWLRCHAINDLNGDGRLEVVATQHSTEYAEHLQQLLVLDDRLQVLCAWKPGGNGSGTAALVSDLDSDGLNEIILGSGGLITVLRLTPAAEAAQTP